MKKIAVTCGDPAGIGPEIIARFLAETPGAAEEIAAVGPRRWLETLPCAGVPVGDADFALSPGVPSADGQRVALAAMERAAAGTLAGEFAAVVTAPVNKAGLKSVGFAFPGQTEFFASRWGGVPVMAFGGGKMRVVLATWHIPLRDVPATLDFARIAHAVGQADFLAKKLGGAAGTASAKKAENAFPRIGVCGLNPHAGEQGVLGNEEIEIIEPILAQLRPRFPGLSHCVPADTIFRRHLLGEFDVVVALYHDQALAPLKTLEFDESVNISLGLTHIRTSPDHGTAYDIAGTGVARAGSFGNAVRVARLLCGGNEM